MLQTNTVEKRTLELLNSLQAEQALATTRLVGGTALSLHIGHRISEDLDLFSTEPLDGVLIQSLLIDKYGFIPALVTGNTLIGYVRNIKIDIIYHPFPWIANAVAIKGMRIAAMDDIAAMKMHAIINSGR